MNIPGLTTTKLAGGAIAARRLAVHGASDGLAVQAAAATALLIGVSTDIPAANGQPVDLIRAGLAPVEYGGTVTRGAPLTADSQGRAVAVTLPVAGTTYIIGYAEVAGVVGDIGSTFIAPAVLTA
ncbi:capsid cement protein [Pseudomonas paralcaligenes]|uniref:capsid cement protein n=1 Tax=Pseudomonas paralcaligenes TaxID=2772558 RepID=UPI001C806471|nr:capsid cement protein [Pseudomonas paralcaligenes]